MPRRFFSEDSFWNQPVGEGPEIDPRSDHYIGLLETEPNGAWGINLDQWTIPVFEANADTPRRLVRQRVMPEDELIARRSKWAGSGDCFRHGPGFGPEVPIPDEAVPDPEDDAHFAVVDWERRIAWDMWAATVNSNNEWESNTGMVYPLDGDGIFREEDFALRDGDSVHFHGPSRAAGVPALAGLIMHDEVKAGHIRHKLACATRFNAYKKFVFPAIWTDGYREDGIPEGAVIQLDPELDIDAFELLPGEKTVARALQEYGAVNVDNAGGSALYGEGLWARPGFSWEGLLTPFGISKIPVSHYRVLKLGEIICKGDCLRGRSET